MSEQNVDYVALDPANLDGFLTTLDGVRVTSVGDDGDVLILGHLDDVRAWTAYCAWQWHYNGEQPDASDRGVYDIERRFARFGNHSEDCEALTCTCAEDEVCSGCRAGEHEKCEDGDYCGCRDDWDHNLPDGAWPCGCECGCDEYGWWVSSAQTGHEVTWVRFSYEKSRASRLTPDGSQ